MKNLKFYLIISVVATTAGICSCSSDAPDIPEKVNMPRQEIQLTQAQQQTLDAELKFAFDFMKKANEEALKSNMDNFSLSPFSMARDLSILANGASGTTLESVMKILHLESQDLSDLNDLQPYLFDALLNADPQVKINIANSVWYNNGYPLYPEFIDFVESAYRAPSYAVDFSISSSTVNKINDWASKNTGGIINNFFKPMDLNPNTRFVLLDALYFNGKWSYKFNPSNTKPMDFYNHGNLKVNVKTMKALVGAETGGDENMTIVRIPYGNKAFSLYVVMADEGHSIDDIINNMEAEKWQNMKNELHVCVLELALPKFKLQGGPDTQNVMQAMGLKLTDPELANMTQEKLPSLSIKQKTSIAVEESGTEAASVSSISGSYTSPGPEKPEWDYIHINRPFIFIIEEFSTNTILFMGKVASIEEDI